MRKRLRKKKRIGEFQEFAFLTGCRLVDNLEEETVDSFIDTFVEKAIEDNGLAVMGGGSGREFGWSVVTERSRGTVCEEQRRMVEKWMTQRSEVEAYYVSPLIDAWHGDFDGVYGWVEK